MRFYKYDFKSAKKLLASRPVYHTIGHNATQSPAVLYSKKPHTEV